MLLQSFGGLLWLASRLKREGGKVQPAALGMPDLMVCTVLALMFIQLAVLNFTAQPAAPAEKALTPVQILAGPLFLLIIACGVAGFLVFRRVSIRELMGVERMPLLRVLAWAIGLQALAFPAVSVLAQLVAQFLPKTVSQEQMIVALFRNEVRQGNYSVTASIFAAAVIMAPLGEEFLFRGYFYPVGKRFFGAAPSAVLTAVIFALLHANVVSFAGLFLLALCWALAYEHTGSLLVPITMHASFNAMNLTALFFQATAAPS
jgi:membrane protease YdiL (CAAX protease family)